MASKPQPVEKLLAESQERAEPQNVYQKIARVTKKLSEVGIRKNQTNTFDKYKFRGIDDVYNALAPAISEVGLVILPEVLEREVVERQAKGGGALFYVTLKVRYHFVSADDSSKHVVEAYGEAMDRGDKATNKAMSAAYKYACFQTFCIPTEAQDADSETHEVEEGEPVHSKSGAYQGKSTGRQSQSVQRTLSEEMGVQVTPEHEEILNYVGAHLAAEDKGALLEVWDGIDADTKAVIYPMLSREEQKLFRQIAPEKFGKRQ